MKILSSFLFYCTVSENFADLSKLQLLAPIFKLLDPDPHYEAWSGGKIEWQQNKLQKLKKKKTYS